ncbi:Hypothetical predicted protein [Olea europaea subsp. europaea]|uniref:Uncharacterized protein n=1 Tax=Olea europaea subsp. europaea TaxID=158383 RepID=A0A8S0U8H1_OLEEU|nr:Hypothetical predicted protein [Olea europaea subsp. europaea]
MKCIDCHSLRSPTLSESRYMQEIKPAKFFCFSSKKSAWLQQDWKRFSVTTRALPSSPFLAAVPLAASPDIAVLLQTSAILLFAYWIANFVVPRMVYKDLQFDKTDENKSPNDKNFPED